MHVTNQHSSSWRSYREVQQKQQASRSIKMSHKIDTMRQRHGILFCRAPMSIGGAESIRRCAGLGRLTTRIVDLKTRNEAEIQ